MKTLLCKLLIRLSLINKIYHQSLLKSKLLLPTLPTLYTPFYTTHGVVHQVPNTVGGLVSQSFCHCAANVLSGPSVMSLCKHKHEACGHGPAISWADGNDGKVMMGTKVPQPIVCVLCSLVIAIKTAFFYGSFDLWCMGFNLNTYFKE